MANPAFNDKTYDKFAQNGYGGANAAAPGGYAQAQMGYPPQTDMAQEGVMTVTGTLNKTLILFALLLAGAAFTFSALFALPGIVLPLTIGGFFGALILSFVLAFRPKSAPITAPLYAVLEGLFIGGWSALIQSLYGGVAAPAVASTLAITGLMLGIYRSGLVKVTDKLRFGVVAATGAIALTYMVSNVMLLLFHNAGMANFFWGNSPLSILVSVVIIGVAAFNLLLDFDLVEKGVARRAPKFMEWYAGYGIMVTVVWLYLELVRLLSKFSRR